jgi:hypothetical protein
MNQINVQYYKYTSNIKEYIFDYIACENDRLILCIFYYENYFYMEIT